MLHQDGEMQDDRQNNHSMITGYHCEVAKWLGVFNKIPAIRVGYCWFHLTSARFNVQIFLPQEPTLPRFTHSGAMGSAVKHLYGFWRTSTWDPMLSQNTDEHHPRILMGLTYNMLI